MLNSGRDIAVSSTWIKRLCCDVEEEARREDRLTQQTPCLGPNCLDFSLPRSDCGHSPFEVECASLYCLTQKACGHMDSKGGLLDD